MNELYWRTLASAAALLLASVAYFLKKHLEDVKEMKKDVNGLQIDVVVSKEKAMFVDRRLDGHDCRLDEHGHRLDEHERRLDNFKL